VGQPWHPRVCPSERDKIPMVASSRYPTVMGTYYSTVWFNTRNVASLDQHLTREQETFP